MPDSVRGDKANEANQPSVTTSDHADEENTKQTLNPDSPSHSKEGLAETNLKKFLSTLSTGELIRGIIFQHKEITHLGCEIEKLKRERNKAQRPAQRLVRVARRAVRVAEESARESRALGVSRRDVQGDVVGRGGDGIG